MKKTKISADIPKSLIDKIKENDNYGYNSRQKFIENLFISFMSKEDMKDRLHGELNRLFVRHQEEYESIKKIKRKIDEIV